MEPKGYTTRGQIENYLLINIDASFHDQVEEWIAQMERHIDRNTGRSFIADSTASERRYDGSGTQKLLIDDCVDVTSVKLSRVDDPLEDDVESDEDPWLEYPLNAQLKNPPVPVTRLELESTHFPKGKQNIYVSGKWGYSVECPADITFATTVLVSGIINFSLNAEGEVQSMTVGRYSVTYKTKQEWQDFERVIEIIDAYKKFTF